MLEVLIISQVEDPEAAYALIEIPLLHDSWCDYDYMQGWDGVDIMEFRQVGTWRLHIRWQGDNVCDPNLWLSI